MDKAYFFIDTRNVEKVREIFLSLKLEFHSCPVYKDTSRILVSFKSSPDEQKAVLKKIKDNRISYSVIQTK